MTATFVKCAACKEAIDSRESSIKYAGNDYHLECITQPPPIITPHTAAERKEIRQRRLAERRLREDADD